MIELSNVIDLALLGQTMARASDKEQAKLLNAWGYQMQWTITSSYDREMQIAYCVQNLDKHGMELVKALGEMLKAKEDADA